MLFNPLQLTLLLASSLALVEAVPFRFPWQQKHPTGFKGLCEPAWNQPYTGWSYTSLKPSPQNTIASSEWSIPDKNFNAAFESGVFVVQATQGMQGNYVVEIKKGSTTYTYWLQVKPHQRGDSGCFRKETSIVPNAVTSVKFYAKP